MERFDELREMPKKQSVASGRIFNVDETTFNRTQGAGLKKKLNTRTLLAVKCRLQEMVERSSRVRYKQRASSAKNISARTGYSVAGGWAMQAAARYSVAGGWAMQAAARDQKCMSKLRKHFK